MNETVISWNLPNIITFLLMIAIIWMVFGAIGHIFVRNSSSSSGASQPLSGTTMDQIGG